MAENAALRALRLLDLVPYLVAHQGASLSEISVHFGVSKDEIIKDLNLLFLCGLPGYTPLELIDLSIEDDVVILRDPQNLGIPRNFNYSETMVLRIALTALGELIPRDSAKHKILKSLESKLAGMFFSEIPTTALNVEIEKENLMAGVVRKAIETNKDLKIRYLNVTKDEISSRQVTPKDLMIAKQGMTLNAYCHLAEGERSFYLSRILEAEVIDASQNSEPSSFEEIELREVRFKIPSGESRFVKEYAEWLQPLSEGIFAIRPHNPKWLLRQFISMGDVQVIEPGDFRSQLAREARITLKRYET